MYAFLLEDNDMAFENVDLFDAVANASLENTDGRTDVRRNS